MWGVRAVRIGRLAHLQNGIVTVGNCIPVVRKHANEGDVLLVFSSTALAGNAEHRDCLLFVGIVSCKMPVAEYNGSEEGGDRLDSGGTQLPSYEAKGSSRLPRPSLVAEEEPLTTTNLSLPHMTFTPKD